MTRSSIFQSLRLLCVSDFLNEIDPHNMLFSGFLKVFEFLRTTVTNPKNHRDNRWGSVPVFNNQPTLGLGPCHCLRKS